MGIKDMFGTLIGTVIGGETLRQVGKVSSFPTGLRKSTQVFISLGVLGNAAKNVRNGFKFK